MKYGKENPTEFELFSLIESINKLVNWHTQLKITFFKYPYEESEKLFNEIHMNIRRISKRAFKSGQKEAVLRSNDVKAFDKLL